MNIGITCKIEPKFFGWFPELEVVDIEKNYDLIIFPGGADVSPSIYGEEKKWYSACDPVRDELEITIFNKFFKNGKTKFFGVCRGHQFLNAITGGFLIQDAYTELGMVHESVHNIIPLNSGKLPEIFGDIVNSTHHQGVITPGENQKVTSIYKNIIESTESDRILTVQWHPEYYNKDYPNVVNFFKYIMEWVTNG